MATAAHIAKLCFAVGMVVAGTVFLVFQMQTPLVLPLMAGSIAWSVLPEN